MESVIKKFFFNEIKLNESRFQEKEEYTHALGKLCECEEKLNQNLTGKEKELFHELMNTESELAGRTAMACFIMGFKLGEKFMMEMILE